MAGGGFDRLGYQRERAKDMAVFGFGQIVEAGDLGVEFGAQGGALGGFRCAASVAFDARRRSEGVEFGGGADEAGGSIDYGGEGGVLFAEAGDGELV